MNLQQCFTLWFCHASIILACITFITVVVTDANSGSMISSKAMNWRSLVSEKALSSSAHPVIFLFVFYHNELMDFLFFIQCVIVFCIHAI